MNRTCSAAFVIAALTFPAGLASPSLAAQGEREKIVDQLLVLSGIDDMLEALQSSADRQLTEQLGGVEGEDALFMRRTFEAAFDPVPIRASVSAALLGNYVDAEAKSALEWYQSDLGSKVRAEESRAQSPEGEREMAAFAQGFQVTPPDPERLELAQGVDAASKSSALSLRLLVEMMRGMLRGISAVAPSRAGKEPPTPEEIDQLIEQQMAQLAPMIQVQSIVTILFSGRNLSIDENRAYLAYIESGPGQWFHAHTGAGLVHAMARAGKAVGDHMAAWGQRKEFAAATEGAEELRQAAMREGEAFGQGTTQSRCTDAAFQRREDCREFMCFGRTRVFLESCLDTSEEEASLCAGAPSSDDLVGSIYWRVGRCEQRGTTSPACNDLMGTIQEYCASARVRL